MARISEEHSRTLTGNVAANLAAELARMAAEAPWREAQKRVDFLGVAQIAFAIDAVEAPEGREAQALRAAAVRFERLLRRRKDRSARENPAMTAEAKARFDAELEVARRYTHVLSAEAQIALAVRDAFDAANRPYSGAGRVPTGLDESGPLIALTRAALYYTPVGDRPATALRKTLEKWPVLRRQG